MASSLSVVERVCCIDCIALLAWFNCAESRGGVTLVEY